MLSTDQRVGIVIPARNEELSIGIVVSELLALRDLYGYPIVDEIVVADNGSTDNTAQIAKNAGAKVVFEPTPGYGHACMRAIGALKSSDVIVFIDGDNAFYPEDLIRLLQPLSKGADLVIGSRVLGHAEVGSHTLQQLWGNKLAVFLVQHLWGHQYTDLGPFRAIRKNVFNRLNMQELTYGWTVEMQIKALLDNRKVCEVPVRTRARIGQSKVSGTLKGSIGAGYGILSTIAKLSLQKQMVNYDQVPMNYAAKPDTES